MIDITAYENALKVLYTDQVLEDLTNQDNPALAMMKRETNFTGDNFPIPVLAAYAQSASASFSSAFNNQTGGVLGKFIVTRSKLYDLATIQREVMKASADKKGAFESVMVTAVNGAVQNVANTMAMALFRSGTGVFGQYVGNTDITAGVITLADPDSATFVEVGQVLRVSTTDDANTGANQVAAKGYVIAVNRSAGKVTVSATVGGSAGTPTGWDASSTLYILVDGNANALSPGIPGWIPFDATVAAGTFYGQSRASDISRFAGSRYDATSDTLEEAFLNASSLLAREGGKPDVAFVSTQIFNGLQKVLQGRLIFIDTKVGSVGFQGLRVNGAKSQITVYQDRNAPLQFGWLLTMKDWCLHSLGGAPELQVDDFGKLLRIADDDAYQIRVSAYYAVECRKPVHQCAVKFAAP